MNYISKSLYFLKSNPTLFLCYIIIMFITMPLQMFQHMELFDITYTGVMLLFYFASIYFSAGLYACIWKAFVGEENTLKKIFKYSNYYLFTYLFVTIFLAIISGLLMFTAIYFHSTIFYPDIESYEYAKQLEANIIRSIPTYMVSILFIFSLPIIYFANFRGGAVIKESLKIIIYNFSISYPVISLITISIIIRIYLTQHVVSYDYSSVAYWEVMAIQKILSTAFDFIIFITASQILRDNYKIYENEAYNNSME